MTRLPIYEHEQTIIAAMRNNNCCVIRAPTGSGKSTQVPQMLLDSELFSGHILVLQPRRLAARMLAARVAEERGSILGREIGFQTRFETLVSSATRIRFITEGILPRMLLSDTKLADVSAVVFDEFHERSLATDLGLALVRVLQRSVRPDLRVVVMSATIDVAPVANFLGCPVVVESTGRMFPVDIRYSAVLPSTKLPVWDMAANAVAGLVTSGATGDVLVFMPGAYEIRKTVESLRQTVRLEKVAVFPLYGDLPADRQRQAMQHCDCRKIIVATNIAETSLTIPGVRHVVDAGLARISRFDSGRGFNTLFTEPISVDSADQRAGRAGRESPGICIRLWTAQHHAGRAARTMPEVLRIDLAETVLHLLISGFTAPETFPWFEKPPDAALAAASDLLQLLGAVDAHSAVTSAGKELSEFPMHPRLARLLLEAGKRGAARLASFAAALLSERGMVFGKPEYPEEAHTHEIASDFYGLYCLIEKIGASSFDPGLCARFAVSASAARNVLRTQALYLMHCRKKGLHTHDGLDAPSALAESLLLAYPDHLCVRRDKGTLVCRLRNGRHAELAPSSLARSAQLLIAAEIRETKDRNLQLKTVLSLATEIRKEWLERHFADKWEFESGVEWNPVSQWVEFRQRSWCLDVLIEETSNLEVDSEKAEALLADIIIQKHMPLPGWGERENEFVNRVRWAAGQFPSQRLPSFSDEDRALVIHAMCDGERRYDNVKEKPALPFLQELLSAQQRRFVASTAPEAVELPNGRKMKIVYETGKQPRGRTRIQDLYGMRQTPRVGDNRVPVLVEILAPSNRPVQTTDDLESFWKIHYPELKKTLSRRYPKHEWR
jgi:ATP-dependent helicase HrpB